ncbi:MAG: peptidylprolyl isomerase [Bacteroidetes bacterium]|nr:peptidylprolyl isomerase [Bacteroidota bacterium]MBU1718554.1 peptidylprolyl isomerase [Bacteroidota bacterium]
MFLPAISQKDTRTKVLISTTFGDITIVLYDETPKHKENFIKLVKEGYFDSLLFHRVISEFMIQGGDPDSKNAAPGVMLGNGGPSYTVPVEVKAGLIHKKGALAGARKPDNLNSSGSQFYIVQGRKFTIEELDLYAKQMGKPFTPQQIEAYTTIGGAPHLDGGYTVFGDVIAGLDVLDKIAAVQVDKNKRPLKDVVMTMKIIN